MTIDPATWPVGILPIVWAIYGTIKLTEVLFLGRDPTRETFGAFLGFVPSLAVIIAWIVGYRYPTDHALWKLFAVSFFGALVWVPLRFYVLQRSKLGAEIKVRTHAISTAKLWGNLGKAFVVFVIVSGIFLLAEKPMQNPQNCTRLMCEVGARILGSQFSTLGFLWIFSYFTITALMGAIVTLVILLKRRR